MSAAGPGRLPPPPLLAPPRHALFADLDGTLAPIRPRPGDVRPDAERARVLDALSGALDGAVAVITGRALEDADRILEGRIAAIAAVHGLRRRNAAGIVLEAAAVPPPASVREAIAAFLAAHPALAAEDKGLAIALHYRAQPSAAGACRTLARRLAAEHGLGVQDGDMVVELRAAGPTKGEAVEAFMAEPPFAGRTPVFIGDDLTDEHGFAGAERLGGHGVIVGPRRPTRARFALDDVGAALAWLAASAGLGPQP
ncbi:MAG: trehalose-phosphatase [Caulobacteraceae bacterium]|nr:trehalose-phosphatase [Caulobacteraceae bacterium]